MRLALVFRFLLQLGRPMRPTANLALRPDGALAAGGATGGSVFHPLPSTRTRCRRRIYVISTGWRRYRVGATYTEVGLSIPPPSLSSPSSLTLAAERPLVCPSGRAGGGIAPEPRTFGDVLMDAASLVSECSLSLSDQSAGPSVPRARASSATATDLPHLRPCSSSAPGPRASASCLTASAARSLTLR
jgi:hypothetical protein